MSDFQTSPSSARSTYELTKAALGSSSASSLNLESSLCFPKDIFYANTFDVDAFLAHYKREYSLERVRDDLNVFLKVLEMSMCELINKDYPDFVNLSTNLVDLDKAINDLKAPLETIKNDVDHVRTSIDDEVSTIMLKLNEKLMIEKRRIVLKLLMNWQRSLKVTNEMIGNDANRNKLSGDHLERISFEFNQLKNSLSICSGSVGSGSSKVASDENGAGSGSEVVQSNDINKLSQMLEKIMQELFLKCLSLKEDSSEAADSSSLKNSSKDKEETNGSGSKRAHQLSRMLSDADLEKRKQLRHLLKSYALLGKQSSAEQLFADHLVKPYLAQYVNEDYLENNIEKLDGVFNKILEFVDDQAEFLQLANEIQKTVQSTSTETNETIRVKQREFNFILNSIWSNVVGALDLNLSVIFSPADADLFHQQFSCAFDFVARFEAKCSSLTGDKELKRHLLATHAYKYFVKKWPVQVYFQIRFQEVVAKFEEDLITCRRPLDEIDPLDSFRLKLSDTLVKQIEYCWLESKCFLRCLLASFWKLNLQLIVRYSSHFARIFQAKLQQMNTPAATADAVATPEQQQQLIAEVNEQDDLTLCVWLMNDLDTLRTLKLPNIFDGVITPIIRACNALKDLVLLKEAYACSLASLADLDANLVDYVVTTQTDKCLQHLRSVNDIPRLYRRTNRDVPKAASLYIGLAVEVIDTFKQTYANPDEAPERQCELVNKCIRAVIDSICIKFHAIASDLLDSVKKMEDSLKRLQRVRQTSKSTANMSSMGAGGTLAISDDDKIRAQLCLDIDELGTRLAARFDNYRGGAHFEQLVKLVQEMCASNPLKQRLNILNEMPSISIGDASAAAAAASPFTAPVMNNENPAVNGFVLTEEEH